MMKVVHIVKMENVVVERVSVVLVEVVVAVAQRQAIQARFVVDQVTIGMMIPVQLVAHFVKVADVASFATIHLDIAIFEITFAHL